MHHNLKNKQSLIPHKFGIKQSLLLRNNPILTDYQIEILKIFFSSSLGRQFFLTGGTALAAFYLGHRLSKDLDLFSIEEFDSLELQKIIEQIADKTHSTVTTKVKTQNYNEVYFENTKLGWIQKVDFIKDQPILFGERKKVDLVIVDSLENITAGKILAIFGRLEAKDFLDLYFICKETGLNFFKLFEKTKKKDTGLDEFYFANMLSEVVNIRDFPKTLKPFNKKELVKFFMEISDKLYSKIKPA